MEKQYIRVAIKNESTWEKALLDGKEYFVCSVVLINEGVHHGSGGHVFYSGEELEKTKEAWNHKPILINHPEYDNKPIQSWAKEVLENQKVGFLTDVDYIKNEKKLKGKAWIEIVKLNKVSPKVAQNIENGIITEVSTGLFVDAEEEAGVWNKEDYSFTATNYRPDHLAILPDDVGACSVEDGAGLCRNKGKTSVISNAMRVIREALGLKEENEVEHTPVLGVNNKKITNKECVMTRKEQVEALVANEANSWSKEDSEFLENLEDTQFEKIENAEPKEKVEPVVKENKDVSAIVPKEEKVVENKEPVTVDAYLAEAPAEIKGVLSSAIANQNKQKDELVAGLVANVKCTFSEDELRAMSLENLQKITSLSVVSDYSINGIVNDSIENKEVPEGLSLPTQNFSKKGE